MGWVTEGGCSRALEGCSKGLEAAGEGELAGGGENGTGYD